MIQTPHNWSFAPQILVCPTLKKTEEEMNKNEANTHRPTLLLGVCWGGWAIVRVKC